MFNLVSSNSVLNRLLNKNMCKFRLRNVHNVNTFDNKVDVVIIGAGAMGSSTAFWLKNKAGPKLSVLVIEKDLSFKTASTVLSVGGIRQQFSLKESNQLSYFGVKFMKNIQKYLGDTADIQFQENGYLTLASEKGREQLKKNYEISKSLCNEDSNNHILLTPTELGKRFSWLNTDGISLACLGVKNEGWFDPWSYLTSLKSKAQELGVVYEEGSPIEFKCTKLDATLSSDTKILKSVLVHTNGGFTKNIMFDFCVIATGADTGQLGRNLLNLRNTNVGPCQFEIPIERRKRFVYCFESPNNGPEIGTPKVLDCSGVYFRREGVSNNYICGYSPNDDEEPPTENLDDIDYDFFTDRLWPILAHRSPSFEAIKVKSAWAGYYDYNYFDQNGIIGYHPAYKNMIIAAGFSGHGIQHSPAVGRAVSELILEGKYTTIDLKVLSFERVMDQKPLLESQII